MVGRWAVRFGGQAAGQGSASRDAKMRARLHLLGIGPGLFLRQELGRAEPTHAGVPFPDRRPQLLPDP